VRLARSWGPAGGRWNGGPPDPAALLSSLPVLFHMYDSDHDGKITLQEYRNVRHGPSRPVITGSPAPASTRCLVGGGGAAVGEPPPGEGVGAVHCRWGHDGGGQHLCRTNGGSPFLGQPRHCDGIGSGAGRWPSRLGHRPCPQAALAGEGFVTDSSFQAFFNLFFRSKSPQGMSKPHPTKHRPQCWGLGYF